MRTENDLSATLLKEAVDAPQLIDVMPQSAVKNGRIRPWLVPVAAAAVVAIAVAVPVAISRHHSSPGTAQPATSTSTVHRQPEVKPAFAGPVVGPGRSRPGNLTLDFTVGPVTGCHFFVSNSNRQYESGSYQCQRGGGQFALYYQGRIEPTGAPVAGYPSYRIGNWDGVQAIMWQYATDSWAAVDLPPAAGDKVADQDPQSIALAVQIARTFRGTAPRSIPVPLRVDLPGFYLQGLSFDGINGSVGLNSGAIVNGSDPEPNAWTIGYSVGRTETSKTNRSSIEVNGQTWKIFDHSSLELYRTGFTMTITAVNGQTYTDDEFRAIAAKITLASNPADPKTWFSSATVLN